LNEQDPLEALARQAELRRRLPAPERRRAIRREAGATLADVGAACGVSGQAACLWECGRTYPRLEHLTRYLDALSAMAGNGGPS